ncbi:hypothetical protein ACTXT7_004791 [Hymenolepis weldensis]
MKLDFRKKDVTQKIDPTLSQLTESVVCTKKNMMSYENLRKNLHERVTKTGRNNWKERKQYSDLVSAIVDESKVKASVQSSVLGESPELRECKRMSLAKKEEGAMAEKLKAVLVNFWMVALPDLDGKNTDPTAGAQVNPKKLYTEGAT